MDSTGVAAALALTAGLFGAVQVAVMGRLGERIGSLLGSDEGGGFTHASAHLDDLRAYVDATKR